VKGAAEVLFDQRRIRTCRLRTGETYCKYQTEYRRLSLLWLRLVAACMNFATRLPAFRSGAEIDATFASQFSLSSTSF